MSKLTFEYEFEIKKTWHGKKAIVQENASRAEKPKKPGRIPRLTKLMALAIRFEERLRDGHVKDMAELARLGHVTRVRVTQIMNLRLLAPEIQEELLRMPRVHTGRAPLTYFDLLPVLRCPLWRDQRVIWKRIQQACLGTKNSEHPSQSPPPAKPDK